MPVVPLIRKFGIADGKTEGISRLPHGDRVHVILVSDHGQDRYDPDHEPFVLEKWIDLEATRIVNGGPYAFVYLESGGVDRAAAMRDGHTSWFKSETSLR